MKLAQPALPCRRSLAAMASDTWESHFLLGDDQRARNA